MTSNRPGNAPERVDAHWEATVYRGREPIQAIPLTDPMTTRVPAYVHFADPVEVHPGDILRLTEQTLGTVAEAYFGARRTVSWIGTRYGEVG